MKNVVVEMVPGFQGFLLSAPALALWCLYLENILPQGEGLNLHRIPVFSRQLARFLLPQCTMVRSLDGGSQMFILLFHLSLILWPCNRWFLPVPFGLVPLALIRRGELRLEMKVASGECQRYWAIKGFL